ncbi:hypothetical protein DIJ64_10515 [Mycobacterium leprae]|uniref:Cyanate lyase C-terminal domain-containing protein n=1 Tax=Mycobacterium leprae TaxID=1769 RepID=A0AAD0KUW1_MYCLR|nr:hypothetical protein DIJ64_10515 [Mycobacterium leprae]
MQVYGGVVKKLINEQCGDGVMRVINFNLNLKKKSHPSGYRIVLTFDSQFPIYQCVLA